MVSPAGAGPAGIGNADDPHTREELMRTQAARTTPLVLFVLGLGLFLVAPASGQLNAPTDNTNTALLVDANYVRRYKQGNPGLQMVDVRSAKAFEETHIPGSFYVPLGLVPHKHSLRGAPVVLVGSGSEPAPLLRVCRELRRKGIRASVLWGGIVAWQGAGGQLTGKHSGHQQLNEVAPATYYRQRGKEYWRVLYVGDKRPQNLDTFLPGAEFAQQDRLASRLENAAGPRLILLVTRKGEDYGRPVSALRAEGIANVFCLEGGMQAYTKHFEARNNNFDENLKRSKAGAECQEGINEVLSNTCDECMQ
jgi:rhodanese-related sulfurtransferase